MKELICLKEVSLSVVKFKTAMTLNTDRTRRGGQEEPVFIALAKISEVLKGTEISPEIVTIFMSEY